MKDLNYYMSLPYRFEVVPDKEDGGWVAHYPDLPGCITQADSWEELLSMLEDAKKSWLTAAIKDGIEIVEPQKEERIA